MQNTFMRTVEPCGAWQSRDRLHEYNKAPFRPPNLGETALEGSVCPYYGLESPPVLGDLGGVQH